MGRALAFVYGSAVYVVFLGTFLYAVGFVTGLGVPKTLDTGLVVTIGEAITVNVSLLLPFAVQHSVMATKTFKRWWTQYVSPTIERSTYVLLASPALILKWRPITSTVWQVTDPTGAGAFPTAFKSA